ncbi:hypothetical protein M0804_003528 [Polistes exclamans]|nr:hypothetical protein M0804_003528 [Polistes exclamans]
MDTESHKNKRGILIRRISDNTSEDFLLYSEIDEDHPLIFNQRRINIIDSDDKFSTKPLSDKDNSGAQKIMWQSMSQTNNNSFYYPWKGDYPEDPKEPYSLVTYCRKLFDSEIISDIVDYTNMYALQGDPAKPIGVSTNEIKQFFACCYHLYPPRRKIVPALYSCPRGTF